MIPIPHSATLSRTLMLLACVTVLLSLAVAVQPADAGVSMDCEGTIRAWVNDGYYRPGECHCSGGQPVCSKASSGGSSSRPSAPKSRSGGLSSKNAMKLQIMQSVMDSAANAFIRWINAPQKPVRTGPTPQEIAAEREEQERAKAEWRAKVQGQITEMESQYAQQERQKVDASKARLLAGMKGLGSGAADRPSNALQQLRCKAYWGLKAAQSLDDEQAREYSRFAENPDAAAMAECAHALPQPPLPSSADEFHTDLYMTMVAEINQRLPLIERAKEKQREADTQFADKQKQVDELKARMEGAASLEENQAADDLLAAAMQELAAADTLKSEADAGVMKLQLEIDALKEVENIASNTNSSSPGKGLVP